MKKTDHQHHIHVTIPFTKPKPPLTLHNNMQISMEALWTLEDKWKLSTQEAVIFFAATTFLVVLAVGLCVTTMFRKKDTTHIQDGSAAKGSTDTWLKGLTRSACWSKASKWDGSLSASRKEQPTPLLVGGGGEVGWPSHNATSPVWQRPILMGEKCEFPKFSGLILYDERGKPLDQGHSIEIQEQPAVKATLRELL